MRLLAISVLLSFVLTNCPTQGDTELVSMTASVNPSEAGSVNPPNGTYTLGQEISVETEAADERWEFTGWTGDTTASADSLGFGITRNMDLVANYEIPVDERPILVTTANPVEGGSVTPDSSSYGLGETVEVTATAADGWQFLSWAGDTTVSANPLTISVDKDYTLSAVFEKKSYQVTTAASPTEGGSVSPTSESYSYGTAVDVQATAASGWAFTGWSGDTTATENPISVIVDKNYTLTANFRELAQPFANRITVSDGQSSKDVVFGMDPSATSGFDAGLDQELPPPPPEGNFYRRFNIVDRGLKDDYRAVSDQRTVWELEFAPEEGRSITLSWDFSTTDHVGSLMLVDDPDNPSVEIDMKSQNQYDATDQSVNTLYIISQN